MMYFLCFVCSFVGVIISEILLGTVNFFLQKKKLAKKQPKQPNYRR